MPAGDLVVADWQGEIRTTLFGADLDLGLARQNPVSGLGVPPIKDTDLAWAQKDGSYGGRDFYSPRVVTVAFLLEGAPATALASLKTLHTIWAPSSVDITLYLRLPGFGKFYLSGRPRGVTDSIDVLSADFVSVDALATFVTTTNHALTYV